MASPSSSSSPAFPARAFVQTFDGTVPPDYRLVIEELRVRGTLIQTRESLPQGLTRDDLIVGDFSWTRDALKQLGIAMPSPPDYPECLRHLLHRRVWQSTLGEVRSLIERRSGDHSPELFIKPAVSRAHLLTIVYGC